MSMTGELIQTQDALQPLFDAVQEDGIDTATREEREIALHNGIVAHLKEVDNTARWFHYAKAQIELLKAEKKLVSEAIELWEDKQKTVRQIAAAHLEATGQKRFQGKVHTISCRKGVRDADILDEVQVPDDYKTVVVTLPAELFALVVRYLGVSASNGFFPEDAFEQVATAKREYTVDKKAIKAALENFEDVPGAALVEGPPTVVVK